MPELPQQFQLFNTLTGKLEPFVPLDPAGKQVKLYVCGPTVYDDAHLGHARCYITWDVLYRFLKFLGYDVTYVRNVTDVDDKILNRARERGETPAEVAERNYLSFAEDMKALNVLPPDEEPRATQYISQMIEVIEGLIAKGAAYVTPEGTVYFRVEAKADYGKLSKKPLDDLRAGARVDVDPHKESPLDFALWKHVSAEEQAQPGHAFESPWGKGRPGWHIECSAMNFACLGPQIDIHAGGADLIFPHHENEIAQTEAWLGLKGDETHRFAKYWMHNGFVNVSGEKMSKSLGNFSTIKKLLERYDANTIRHFLLTNKYRMPVDFNDEALMASKNWIIKTHRTIKAALDKLGINRAQIDGLKITKYPDYPEDNWRISQFEIFPTAIASLSEDLNTPKGISLLDALISHLNAWADDLDRFNKSFLELDGVSNNDFFRRLVELTVTLFDLLGFSPDLLFNGVVFPINEIRTIYKEMTGEWLAEDQAPEECLKTIVSMRKRAKEIKNWGQADAIRKHLTDIGLQLLDNKDGTTSVEKDGLEIVRV